ERTAVGSVSHVFRDYFRHVADAPFVEKLIAATSIVVQVYLGYKLTRLVLGFGKNAINRRVKKSPVVTQSVDAQHDQVVRSLLNSNILLMHDEEAFLGYALGVGGSLILMNRHIFDGLQ
ncbi:MAG: hypothetical protein NWF05_12165, partial [Candidatus Bathyarchaeota archaeon]|nr:hypothetical protein [Candidatus Bathyarchaeota archaeon]